LSYIAYRRLTRVRTRSVVLARLLNWGFSRGRDHTIVTRNSPSQSESCLIFQYLGTRTTDGSEGEMVCIHCRRRNDRECKTVFSVNSKDAAKLRNPRTESYYFRNWCDTCSVKIVVKKRAIFGKHLNVCRFSESQFYRASVFREMNDTWYFFLHIFDSMLQHCSVQYVNVKRKYLSRKSKIKYNTNKVRDHFCQIELITLCYLSKHNFIAFTRLFSRFFREIKFYFYMIFI